MKRIVLSLISLFALLTSHALAAGQCDGCKRAEEIRTLPSGVKQGRMSTGKVCVYVTMPNQCDTILVEADSETRKSVELTFYRVGRAAAEAKAGQVQLDSSGQPTCRGGEVAMVCMPRGVLESSVTEVRLIPGNKGTCGVLKAGHIKELLRRGTIPSDDPVRLGWAAPGANHAPKEAGK